jgi:alkanesulfonate monooxygenase SsuD/methylene tetrahydromethanopterin reductase-like flavin-dependent oxidoreductase (luciferase family)
LRHIGYNLDHGGLHYDEILSLAKLGDELNFDSISFYDHFYSLSGENEICLEVWSLLPAISLNTKRVKLIPLVTNNLFRHPGILAKIASTVDNLSKGRLIFGIGAGWYKKEALDFGYDFPKLKIRLEMLDESIQVISKLWKEDKTTFKGRHYSLEGAESLPKPFQVPHPPILVGGKTRGVLRIVSKYADMCNFTLRGMGIEGCVKKLAKLKEMCSEVGRDYNSISKTISGPCFFAVSNQELEKELEEDAKVRQTSKEELREFYKNSALFGTIEEVVDQIRKYEEIGVDGAMFRFYKRRQGAKAKLFSEEILPKIKN